jgi:hypothetical protein
MTARVFSIPKRNSARVDPATFNIVAVDAASELTGLVANENDLAISAGAIYAYVGGAWVAASAASGGSGGGLPAGAANYGALMTTKVLKARPALPTLPAAGSTFTDPTFGTSILRVTDGTFFADNKTAYSYWPSANADSTMFICNENEVPYLYDFNGAAMTISNRRVVFTSGPPAGGSRLHWESLQWSHSDPAVVYGWADGDELKFYKYNVTTHLYTLLFDGAVLGAGAWAGHTLWQLTFSSDENRFCLMRKDRNTGDKKGWFVWDKPSNTLKLSKVNLDFDEVQIDLSGHWVIYKTGTAGSIWHVDTNTEDVLTDGGPDYMPKHSDNGPDLCVGFDNYEGRILSRALSSPHTWSLVWNAAVDMTVWPGDFHLGMNAAETSGVVVLSMYQASDTHTDNPMGNEIILVKLDGSQGLYRVCHHRGGGSQYYDSPRANISRDGKYIFFTSNWEGTLGAGRRDFFVVRAGA